MNKKSLVVAVVLFLAVPAKTSAWGVLGHRVIGGIADQYLGAKARAEIRKLLGNESLAMASNWADFIKSDRRYDSLDRWHYINVPGGLDEPGFMNYIRGETSANLYSRMNFLVRELRSKKVSQDKQVFYLKLLIHFVADAHQPMHTGRPADRAGNTIKLYWFNQPTNLHRVWDEHLIEFQQLSYSEHVAAINFTTQSQREKWQKQPIHQWLYESYQAAQKLYEGIKAEDRLTYAYNYHHVDLLNQQLLKGGVRLAGLLNDIYGK